MSIRKFVKMCLALKIQISAEGFNIVLPYVHIPWEYKCKISPAESNCHKMTLSHFNSWIIRTEIFSKLRRGYCFFHTKKFSGRKPNFIQIFSSFSVSVLIFEKRVQMLPDSLDTSGCLKRGWGEGIHFISFTDSVFSFNLVAKLK